MKTFTTTVEYQGEEIIVQLPMQVEDCEFCGGRGTFVNPSIDGNGISTSDECWQDDDFRDMYLGGTFDETCTLCDGKGAIWRPVVTDDSPMPEKMAYDNWNDDYSDRHWELERNYNRRAGRYANYDY